MSSQETITWHDVNDRLPGVGITVLARTDDDELPVWPAYLRYDGEWNHCDTSATCEVSHWADMPKGPEVA